MSDPKGCHRVVKFDKIEMPQNVVKRSTKAVDCTSFRVKIFRESEYGGIAQLGARYKRVPTPAN